jgi:PTS system mannose-specific IIA component
MFGILLVTHDQLGEQLLAAARNIVNHKVENINCVSVGWQQDLDIAREKITDQLTALKDNDEGTVILTDMFGGTPTNISLTFTEDLDIEILTGVNLPILIKLIGLQKSGVSRDKAIRIARDRGRQSIMVASEVLSGQEEESEENE